MKEKTRCVGAEGIWKSVPGPGRKRRALLRDVNLRLRLGEIVGISGGSGSGKTTLGDILLGILRADRGRVTWGENDLASLNSRRRRMLRPRYQKIYQNPGASFPPGLTVREALMDLFKVHRFAPGPREAAEQLVMACRDVRLHPALLDRFPDQLSGGETQRFALARALLLSPCFLVADEPTSRLDPSAQALVSRLIMRLARDRAMAVLFISHDPELLSVVCDRVQVLENGALHSRIP